jgi:hypothetical protein
MPMINEVPDLTAVARRTRARSIAAMLAMLAASIVAALGAPGDALAAPAQLWQKCDPDEPVGQQCFLPRGIAADRNNGHVFVADQSNARVVEFDALGNFIKTWGRDVVDGGGTDFEVCVPEEGDTCKPGIQGSESGEFGSTGGVAIDSSGNVYVTDGGNSRVQKFSPAGQFVLMVGGEVNKTKTEEPGSTEAERNLCTAASGDECQPATEGAGKGQFDNWAVGDFITVDGNGTATDADDAVYVGDEERIQRFGTDGVYQGELTLSGKGRVQSLDVDSSGNLYVDYESALGVQKLSPAGEELAPTFELPKPDEFTTRLITAVAVDSAGHVHVFADPSTRNGFQPINRIYEFDSAGNVVDEFGASEFASSTGIAANLCSGSEGPGNLYVSNVGTDFGEGSDNFVRAYGAFPLGCFKALTKAATKVTETSATLNGTVNPDGALTSECRFEWGATTAYGNIAPCAESPAEIGEGAEPVAVHADISGLQGASTYHFRLRAKIGGGTETSPDAQFKTLGPPVIGDEHLVAATDQEAAVKALVNPEGFPTGCRIEYGTTPAYGQSTPEASVGADRTDHVTSLVLGGLEPGTTYHWRFVCENDAVLNGGVVEGADRTLTTYRRLTTETGCGNEAFRTGTSALLPDCRAYEMVSPVDKNGADIVGRADDGGSYAYVQARPDGEKLTYSSAFPAFGEDPPNSFVINQYLATRGADGWSNEGIHPPLLGRRLGVGVGAFREFMAFTPDLCSAWLLDGQTPPLTPDGQEGEPNLVRRQNCEPGAGAFETLTTAPLPEEIANEYVGSRSVQGVSEDGRHAIFRAGAKLTADAATGTHSQLYDRFDGDLHLVSVLPSGKAETKDAEVGGGWNERLANAVSADGSAVYWTSPNGSTQGGKIYVRRHPEQGIVSGECVNAARACTIPVSAGTDGFFWAGARDGSGALYSEGNFKAGTADLYRFNLATKASQLVVEDIMGVAGASEDLSRVYFVSREAIPGSGENGEGEEAQDGQPNLYLSEAGGFEFIATLVAGDVGVSEPGAVNILAYSLTGGRPATRVTPDGAAIAFQTRAPVGSFDNSAVGSLKPAVEVYLYQAGGELRCVSCNPSGARPVARKLGEAYKPRGIRETGVIAAAWIPTWEQPQHDSNVLSEDGSRLFFNANDALVPHDANGAQDVYEWEAAGTGRCDTEDPSYFPQNGGCIYLISSGQNPFESIFWEASPDGEDVFFTTAASLLPQDPGSIDLYDARVGGGFPPPPNPPECEGEACQSPPPTPNFGEPASAAYKGPGNVQKGTTRPRCPKGRRAVRKAGKVRCLKKRARERQTGGKRRAQR